jgi:hypothetical protein
MEQRLTLNGRSHLYPVSQDVVMTLMLWSGDIGCFWLYGSGVMRNPTLGLRRISLPRTRVNKDHQTRLSLLVNEEYAGAKLVRCSPYAGLGVHILRPTLYELLAGGGKLAAREVSRALGCTTTPKAICSL